MSTYKLSDVTALNGNPVVQINNSDSVLGAVPGSMVQIGTEQIVFLDSVDIENSQITLTTPWPYADAVNAECTIAPMTVVSTILNAITKANELVSKSLAIADVSSLFSYSSVAALAAAYLNGDLQAGVKAETDGYYEGSTVGGLTYILRDATVSTLRPPEASGPYIHVGNEGKYLEGIVREQCLLEAFGASHDNPSTHPVAFSKALTYAKSRGLKIKLLAYTYYISSDLISLANGDILRIEGEDKELSCLSVSGNGSAFIAMTTSARVRLADLTLTCDTYNCPLIMGLASNSDYYLSVQARRVIFDVSGHNKCHGVFVQGFKDDTFFENCIFIGSSNPDLNGAHYNVQRLLSIPDDGQPNGDNKTIRVDNCVFINGAQQFSTFGTNSPASPIHLSDSKFYYAFCRAIHLYHGEDSFVGNNFILGARGYKTSIQENNIGGAVWLDIYSAVTAGSHNGVVYKDNIIRDCAGVALFVEEMFGVLSGWTVNGTTTYPNGYTYDNGHGFVTDGGFGLVVTGGSRRLTISGRFEDNEVGIVIDPSLGVEPDLSIGIVNTSEANIDQNRKHGVLIRNALTQFNARGGTMVGNGLASENTYDAIHIERDADNNDKIGQLTLNHVVFDDTLTPLKHRHCVGKTYVGMYMDMENCALNSLDNYVNSGGTMSGQIRYNRCLEPRYWNISGVDTWYYQNLGYRSEYATVVTVNNGYGEFDLELDASPHRANVNVINSLSGITAHHEFDLPNRRIRILLRDSAGNQVTTQQRVSFAVAIAKSAALIG